jgi:Fur family peroxide stress response transcriptional regulator
VEATERLENLIEKLRKHGYRLTPQRMAILKVLTESQDHPSVDQVYAQVRTDFPMTSLATVYKAVSLLKEEGEILELPFGNGSSRYDGAHPFPHPHLMCVKCQRIIDPDIQAFDQLPHDLAEKYGFEIVNHRLDFFGVCPQCQQAEKERVNSTVTPVENHR